MFQHKNIPTNSSSSFFFSLFPKLYYICFLMQRLMGTPSEETLPGVTTFFKFLDCYAKSEPKVTPILKHIYFSSPSKRSSFLCWEELHPIRRIWQHNYQVLSQLVSIFFRYIYILLCLNDKQPVSLFFIFSINCNTLLAPVVYCKLVLFLGAYACVFTSQKMLRMDPKERITVNDALEHYYFGDLVSVP